MKVVSLRTCVRTKKRSKRFSSPSTTRATQREPIVLLALDPAASEFYDGQQYVLRKATNENCRAKR